MEVIKVDNLTKKIKGKIILNNLSFSIEKEKITGIVGPNGAGKSTLIKTMLGLYHINKGNIYINSYSIKKNLEKCLENIGCIIENPDMYNNLSGKKNIELYSKLNNANDLNYINKLISWSKLENRINDKVKTYSLGMKQRLGIVCALINKPKILILDEPTNGLDPFGIKELREFLKLINKEMKITIILCSHMLEEMQKVCDEIIMIDNGKFIEKINVRELLEKNMSLEDIFIEKLHGSKGQLR
ncbi:MAG: ABC transporter ATP-binding protein [Clostridium sp.]|nr:ABC transporter ATP-binding protein [Clostridium sp.]MCM1444426.1 ABC transporter ATP-binding protein [Candidatus Amulumruptor caecigallinarius]